jgi:DUF4097 and DUF4098 domain-containing protein YvlB
MLHRVVITGVLGVALLLPAVAAAQDRDRRWVTVEGERQSKRFKVGEAGSLRLSNLAGDVTVTGGGGSEIQIDAVKYGKGRSDAEARGQFDFVEITMQQSGSRVDVETQHKRGGRAWVDYTVAVPAGTALELRSVSGDIRIRNVNGEVRAETVSGDVATAALSRIVSMKSVSGDVELDGGGSADTLTLSSVSGDVLAKQIKARVVQAESVSGDVQFIGCTCEQGQAQSVSGDIGYSGRLDKQGRYAFKSHSGDIIVTSTDGFELDAATFSGSIQAKVPLTTRAGMGEDGARRGPGRTVKGTVSGGGAFVEVRTFSGSTLLNPK